MSENPSDGAKVDARLPARPQHLHKSVKDDRRGSPMILGLTMAKTVLAQAGRDEEQRPHCGRK